MVFYPHFKMVKNNLEERCKKSVIKMANNVEKIRSQLYKVEDINQKLSHIIRNLGEEYYYGKRLKESYQSYNNDKKRK